MSKWNRYTSKEIKPTGWLKRQLEIQASSLSGNLDKVWPDVRDSAWIGGDREGWERVPYWLDGFIPLAYLLEDEDMIGRAKKYIRAILDAQCEDGWICPCTQDQRKTYDTWAVQLITKVLTVYYECSGDETIPPVLYNVLKNYYALLQSGEIRLFEWGKFRWFEACIAIRLVYNIYRESWLLDLVRLLKTQGVDYSDFIPLWKRPLNRWCLETHIVNLVMMLKAEAVSCELLSQPYTDHAEELRSILEQYNGTVYESFTGDECLSGVSPIQGTECCAIVEQMYSYELLYAYTGDEKWAERLEVLAFNALPATISDDMWTHQYVQMSNQIACQKFPGKPVFRTNGPEAHIFGLEPNFGCCTANFNQGWPKLALSSFMFNEDTVLHAVMLPCELHTDDKHIVVTTAYPFENAATYAVRSETDFTLQIRIPSFAKNVRCNGEAFTGKDLKVAIEGGKDTTVTVQFEVEPYLKKRPLGLQTVQWGSLLFSVPITYTQQMHEYEANGVVRQYPYCDYELIPQSSWNYAYCTEELAVKTNGISDIPFSSKTPPVVISTKVKQIPWGFEDGYETVCAKTPLSTEPLSEALPMELYPYACAKLRMTELPFIE